MAAGDGLVTMTPTSIAFSGTSASINADGGVDFSAVTSLSLNGVFTGNYDNYRISWSGINTVQNRGMNSRLRVSGVDASGTDYTRQQLVADNTSVSASRTTSSNFMRLFTFSTSHQGFDIYIYGPALSQPTATRSVGTDATSSALLGEFVNTHSLSTAYDGITIYPGGDAMSGTIVVFGYEE